MKKEKQQSALEKIKSQIISNSKDARFTEKLVDDILREQKFRDERDKLLDIPLSEIKEERDFGACKVYRTIRGYAFEAKGGMITFVDNRMARTCAMFNSLFAFCKEAEKIEEDNPETYGENETYRAYDAFNSALQYIMQAPIFASLDEQSMFKIATAILQTFNEFGETNYTNAEVHEETEQDIKENIEFENINKAMEQIIESDQT